MLHADTLCGLLLRERSHHVSTATKTVANRTKFYLEQIFTNRTNFIQKFVLLVYIILRVEQMFTNYQNKILYIPNKLYKLTEQIIDDEQIFIDGKIDN
jgi:hypothetical protein